MSDEQGNGETPKVVALPTFKRDQEAASFAEMARTLVLVRAHAADIAATKRVLYLAYVSEGFNDAQALELAKTLT